MLKAQYERRDSIPQAVISPVAFTAPALTSGQVLVQVLAAPINPSDVLTLTGQYGSLPPLPAVGGNEGVGRVVELGPDVRGLEPGVQVLLPAGTGTWTTHLVAEATKLMPLPGDADPQQLCMLTINPPTAAVMLSDFVALAPGDWVIQNAANSGVGGYVTQLARLRGFRTVNVVRREPAVSDTVAAGGDVVLVDGDDLRAQVAKATGGAKIRLALDAVGGAATERLAGCLTGGATVVHYGAMSGEPCSVSGVTLIFRDITVRGFWLAKWFRTTPPEQQRALFGELAERMARGELHARIQATYPVAEIKEAVTAAAQGERSGKILIVPSSADNRA